MKIVKFKEKVFMIEDKFKIGKKINFFAKNENGKNIFLGDLLSQQKKKILSIIPKIDTSVCSLQTQKLYKYFQKQQDKFVVITISLDKCNLQKSFCQNILKTNQSSNFFFLSDHEDKNFSKESGLEIQELKLLARGIIVLDEENKIIYKEIPTRLDKHPNYEKLINFLEI